MNATIHKTSKYSAKDNLVLLCNKDDNLKEYGLSSDELSHIHSRIKRESRCIVINQYQRWVIVQVIKKKNPPCKTFEQCRNDGCNALNVLNENKAKSVTVIDVAGEQNSVLAFAEGMALGNYQFLKYFKDARKKAHSLRAIRIVSKSVKEKDCQALQTVVDATCKARDLVNEPNSYLTARQFSKEIQKLGSEAGFKVEVFGKARIKALKMGGLLAVNQGSPEPPTFNILDWKPKNAVNKKPYILVGKGVVYDTGGLSLKPTPKSMDQMKSDMAGAAAVACTLYAIARSKLPLHIIALIPATDNRPDGNAYAPGDVVKMYNGTTVEVLNTDAEGRMILADALAYARKYSPELVIDLATLTGSAVRAIGTGAIVSMSTAEDSTHTALKDSGLNTYERLVEMPLWDEYRKDLKSDIADIKNIGGINAGMITAGKFLEHFTMADDKHSYPWIHLDIAGPAFLEQCDSYHGKGGTGAGVRLLYDFFKQKAK